jgi:glyoxylase-like metal-dependent hydrolase (beta-lactamase superfamily II)
MNIYALQTGVVHVKADFLKGSADAGSSLRFLGRLFTDRNQVSLPIYAWLIEHDEGLIVVDTGDRADTGSNVLSQSTFTARQDEQIGAQLARLGFATEDVSRVVLTHLHGDHVNGLADLEGCPVFLGEREYAFYSSRFGGLFTRRTTRLPPAFNPKPLVFEPVPVGSFTKSVALTRAGDVLVVPTPGHTGGHVSVIAIKDGVHYFLAGDVTYSQTGLLGQQLQGPSLSQTEHVATLARVLDYARTHPTVYLPAHDWGSGPRLENLDLVPDER